MLPPGDVRCVKSIEGEQLFPDGSLRYLVHWIFKDRSLDFTWERAEFFAKCPDLVAQYWNLKAAGMGHSITQTDRGVVAYSAVAYEDDDPFANFVPRPATAPADAGRSNLRRRGVIARVLDYAGDTRSFLVLFADEPAAVWLAEDVVLGASAGLIADFFIAGNGAAGDG
jgi:hypothetical protein